MTNKTNAIEDLEALRDALGGLNQKKHRIKLEMQQFIESKLNEIIGLLKDA